MGRSSSASRPTRDLYFDVVKHGPAHVEICSRREKLTPRAGSEMAASRRGKASTIVSYPKSILFQMILMFDCHQ
jgi:hypothetical protein